MSRTFEMKRPREPLVPQPPARCPHCGASDMVTTSKVIDANTYWRCQTCGEVWNIDRRGAASRFGYRR